MAHRAGSLKVLAHFNVFNANASKSKTLDVIRQRCVSSNTNNLWKAYQLLFSPFVLQEQCSKYEYFALVGVSSADGFYKKKKKNMPPFPLQVNVTLIIVFKTRL